MKGYQMNFRKDVLETGGSKLFLKLKDGESVQGVFRGDIKEFFIKWENGKSSEVAEGTEGASFRFRVNFLKKENQDFIAMVFEQGVTVYRLLSEINEEYPLESTVVKITRTGTGTDTTYSVLPLLKQALTYKDLQKIKSVKLNELTKQKHNGEGYQRPEGVKNLAPGADDDIPF
jgi:hypothetical protein